MARTARKRSKNSGRKPRRTQPTAKRGASTPWPTIEDFLASEEGNITLGALNEASLGYTAVVSDGHDMLVALVRKRGETLHQLLDRLALTLAPALEHGIYVDEINES